MALRPDTEIQALLAAEKAAAVPPADLVAERARAMDFYLGDMEKHLPAPVDGSSAVSSDVADTIEDLMPELMEVFCAGDEVVRFEPVGAEDEQAAEQETDVVNHVFWNSNPGFLILYTFIKDALLQKVGITKVYWDAGEDLTRERYEGLDEGALGLLLADDGVTLVAKSERPELTDAGPVALYDVDVDVRRSTGRARVMPVPPEEFGTSPKAVTIPESPYCYHTVKRTAAGLIAEGYDRELIESLPAAGGTDTEERQARQTVERDADASASIAKEMRELQVTEHYIRSDLDGTGTRLWRVCTVGDKLLTKEGRPDIELYPEMPFARLTPFPQPHQFWGRSVADLVVEVQRIKTALTRAWLDNTYLLNNSRLELAESHALDVTLDDVLTNRPGGVVRTKMPGGLTPIANQPIGQHVSPLLEYMDARREQRSGATRQGMGMDPNALQNTSATASNLLAQAATARVRLIARIFAETGIKDLFLLLHGVLRRHETRELTLKLRNKWVPVRPREWQSRTDMTVHVGLGTGSKQQQQAFLGQLLGMQMKALEMQGGPAGPMVNLRNIYNTLKRQVEAAGLRSVEPYFMEPPENLQLPPKGPPPEALKAQADIKVAMLKLEAETQLQRERMAAEVQLKREQFQAEMALRREQMILEGRLAAVRPEPIRMGGEVG